MLYVSLHVVNLRLNISQRMIVMTTCLGSLDKDLRLVKVNKHHLIFISIQVLLKHYYTTNIPLLLNLTTRVRGGNVTRMMCC